jgi:pimeloyl-ACP methyl ester carboxylesterase
MVDRIRFLLLALAVSLVFLPCLAGEGRTVSLPGLEMYYEDSGEGEPLVLLHGILQSGRMYDPLVEALDGAFRTIAVDLRGHGGSTNPGGEFTFRQSARDVFALLDELGVTRFRAIGYSAGAETLLHMATGQPDRLEAMILIGSGTYLSSDCRETLSKIDPENTPETSWAHYRGIHRNGDGQIRSLLEITRGLKDSYGDIAFTPARLATIRARTLLIQGDRDYCFPLSMTVDMQQAIPDATVWVLPGAGHWPFREDQIPLLAENVLAFLGGS